MLAIDYRWWKFLHVAGVIGFVLFHGVSVLVAFRLRNVHRFSVQRLLCAIALVALVPAAVELPALATLALLAALLVALIVYETIRFAELRDRLRHEVAQAHA